MKSLSQLRADLTAGAFDFSYHAFRRSVERDISEREIREAGENLVVIEQYPDDKYGPTVLLLGFTESGRPLHIQVSVTESPQARIVTLYEPDKDEWQDYARRR